jgi:RNA polymerase sigma-70 factor (ECF subfamily)
VSTSVAGLERRDDDVALSLTFDEVFRRFGPYVAQIGARILGRASEVDDFVQDVFIDVHRGLPGLRDNQAVRGWLRVIAVRRARRRLKRWRLMRFLSLEGEATSEALVDTLASADVRARVGSIYRVLDRVSVDARVAWVMHHVEGESLDDIATTCGGARATAHRRVTEAQHALEKAVER